MQRGGAGQQVEGLEDEADLLVANAGEFVVIEFADHLAVEPVETLARRIEAADQVHQRRLAGSRRTHDGDILVALDTQVHATQRVYLLFGAHVIGLPEIFGADDAGRRGRGHLFISHACHLKCCHPISFVEAAPANPAGKANRATRFRRALAGAELSTFTLAPLLQGAKHFITSGDDLVAFFETLADLDVRCSGDASFYRYEFDLLLVRTENEDALKLFLVGLGLVRGSGLDVTSSSWRPCLSSRHAGGW